MASASIFGGPSRTYWHDRFDEALRNSREDAGAFKRDARIKALLNERKRSVMHLKWHIDVPDVHDPDQKQVRDVATAAIESIFGFQDVKSCLLESIWYGKYAVQWVWGKRWYKGVKTKVPLRWEPLHGDKIGYQWQDDGSPDIPYVLVHGGSVGFLKDRGGRVIPTTNGLALLLKRAWRGRFTIHHHEIEDWNFWDGEQALLKHGVGLRSHVYWTEYLRKEIESWITDFMERVGLGVMLWKYEAGNSSSLAEVTDAAKAYDRRVNVFVPCWPDGTGKMIGGVERVDPPLAGCEFLRSLMEYFDRQIERLFIGQEGSAKGMSAGLGNEATADFMRSTKEMITREDATRFGESLTGDEWNPSLLNQIIRWTEWPNPAMSRLPARMLFGVESTASKDKMVGLKQLFDMGIAFREMDGLEAVGVVAPVQGDAVCVNHELKARAQAAELQNKQAEQQAAGGGMPGEPGAPGAPGEEPPPEGPDGGGEEGAFWKSLKEKERADDEGDQEQVDAAAYARLHDALHYGDGEKWTPENLPGYNPDAKTQRWVKGSSVMRLEKPLDPNEKTNTPEDDAKEKQQAILKEEPQPAKPTKPKPQSPTDAAIAKVKSLGNDKPEDVTALSDQLGKLTKPQMHQMVEQMKAEGIDLQVRSTSRTPKAARVQQIVDAVLARKKTLPKAGAEARQKLEKAGAAPPTDRSPEGIRKHFLEKFEDVLGSKPDEKIRAELEQLGVKLPEGSSRDTMKHALADFMASRAILRDMLGGAPSASSQTEPAAEAAPEQPAAQVEPAKPEEKPPTPQQAEAAQAQVPADKPSTLPQPAQPPVKGEQPTAEAGPTAQPVAEKPPAEPEASKPRSQLEEVAAREWGKMSPEKRVKAEAKRDKERAAQQKKAEKKATREAAKPPEMKERAEKRKPKAAKQAEQDFLAEEAAAAGLPPPQTGMDVPADDLAAMRDLSPETLDQLETSLFEDGREAIRVKKFMGKRLTPDEQNLYEQGRKQYKAIVAERERRSALAAQEGEEPTGEVAPSGAPKTAAERMKERGRAATAQQAATALTPEQEKRRNALVAHAQSDAATPQEEQEITQKFGGDPVKWADAKARETVAPTAKPPTVQPKAVETPKTQETPHATQEGKKPVSDLGKHPPRDEGRQEATPGRGDRAERGGQEQQGQAPQERVMPEKVAAGAAARQLTPREQGKRDRRAEYDARNEKRNELQRPAQREAKAAYEQEAAQHGADPKYANEVADQLRAADLDAVQRTKTQLSKAKDALVTYGTKWQNLLTGIRRDKIEDAASVKGMDAAAASLAALPEFAEVFKGTEEGSGAPEEKLFDFIREYGCVGCAPQAKSDDEIYAEALKRIESEKGQADTTTSDAPLTDEGEVPPEAHEPEDADVSFNTAEFEEPPATIPQTTAAQRTKGPEPEKPAEAAPEQPPAGQNRNLLGERTGPATQRLFGGGKGEKPARQTDLKNLSVVQKRDLAKWSAPQLVGGKFGETTRVGYDPVSGRGDYSVFVESGPAGGYVVRDKQGNQIGETYGSAEEAAQAAEQSGTPAADLTPAKVVKSAFRPPDKTQAAAPATPTVPAKQSRRERYLTQAAEAEKRGDHEGAAEYRDYAEAEARRENPSAATPPSQGVEQVLAAAATDPPAPHLARRFRELADPKRPLKNRIRTAADVDTSIMDAALATKQTGKYGISSNEYLRHVDGVWHEWEDGAQSADDRKRLLESLGHERDRMAGLVPRLRKMAADGIVPKDFSGEAVDLNKAADFYEQHGLALIDALRAQVGGASAPKQYARADLSHHYLRLADRADRDGDRASAVIYRRQAENPL